ncbi:hypothetical protein ACRRVD_03325 [Candidatus Cardinium hertigii]|uniref:hypothetical protein n=1 Tax=Candidatus Cardinium hertigii TaxID=247481 RepID=UPI003D7DFD44
MKQKARQEGREEGIRIGEQKGKLEGRLEGKLEGKLEIAKTMLSKGYSIEDIMLITGLHYSDIHSII